jgi:hypothetical protein
MAKMQPKGSFVDKTQLSRIYYQHRFWKEEGRNNELVLTIRELTDTIRVLHLEKERDTALFKQQIADLQGHLIKSVVGEVAMELKLQTLQRKIHNLDQEDATIRSSFEPKSP